MQLFFSSFFSLPSLVSRASSLSLHFVPLFLFTFWNTANFGAHLSQGEYFKYQMVYNAYNYYIQNIQQIHTSHLINIFRDIHTFQYHLHLNHFYLVYYYFVTQFLSGNISSFISCNVYSFHFCGNFHLFFSWSFASHLIYFLFTLSLSKQNITDKSLHVYPAFCFLLSVFSPLSVCMCIFHSFHVFSLSLYVFVFICVCVRVCEMLQVLLILRTPDNRNTFSVVSVCMCVCEWRPLVLSIFQRFSFCITRILHSGETRIIKQLIFLLFMIAKGHSVLYLFVLFPFSFHLMCLTIS